MWFYEHSSHKKALIKSTKGIKYFRKMERRRGKTNKQTKPLDLTLWKKLKNKKDTKMKKK